MKLPKQVQSIMEKFEKNGFQSYIVGGCVRDALRKAEPNDWDIATNAKPEETMKIFPNNFYNNNFGTVTVLSGSKKEQKKGIEITPFRTEEKYTDKRHPDKIKWAETIEQDLSRRDFTVNSMAMGLELKIIDPFNGQKDLKDKIIRTVGDPEKRFSEDALRLMRAIRFAITLGPNKTWKIEEKTKKAIQKKANLLRFISKERTREELMKIIISRRGAEGIEILRKLGLLKYIIPELELGFGIGQNKHHIYQIYQHNILSLEYACKKEFSKYVRVSALLHDVGKPKAKQGDGLDSTFYNHEIIGAKIAKEILQRLRFSKKDIEKIVKLVRYHLFYYNVGEVGEASVRKLVREVGQENVDELLQLRMCDRIGSGVPKAEPYKLRHLRYIIEKVSQDPVSVKMLEIKGNDIIQLLKISPGPKIGYILNILLSNVLDDPKRNKRQELEKEVKKLSKLEEKDFEKLVRQSKQEIKKIEIKRDQMTKKKYWVT
jgi:poly(A) polymerase/tRNA nucleotidyltransferase (CCA-adding enzyme)